MQQTLNAPDFLQFDKNFVLFFVARIVGRSHGMME